MSDEDEAHWDERLKKVEGQAGGEIRLTIRVHRWGYVWAAAFYFVLSAAEYMDPVNAFGSPWHRYKWLLFFAAGIGALSFAFLARQRSHKQDAS